MSFSFNLIDEPWIPCITTQHRYVEVSLRDLIAGADTIRMLAGESPLHNAGIMTLLLALSHRVYGPPSLSAWENLWTSGRFPIGPLDQYLVSQYQRFDLFHPERPFFQTYSTLGIELRSVVHLILSSGNNGALFSHDTEERGVSFSPAQAVRELLASRAFHTAGPANPKLKLYFSSSPYTDGILFFVEGDNLFETLLLNMPTYPNEGIFPTTEGDLPAWEMDDPYAPREIPLGYLDYLTWQSARTILQPEIIAGEVRVQMMRIAPALSLASEVQSPQKLYFKRETKDGEFWASLRFSEHRALWRDYDTILNREYVRSPAAIQWMGQLVANSEYFEHAAYRIRAMGFLADKAKPILYRDQLLPLSVEYLRQPNHVETLNKAKGVAEDGRNSLNFAQRVLASTLIVHGGDRKPDTKDISSLVSHWAADNLYWTRLEPAFWQLVDMVPADPDSALRAWVNHVRQLAIDTYEDVVRSIGEVNGLERGAVEGRRALNASLKKALGEYA